jgi:hypothetical protein
MKKYGLNILISIDQFFNTVLGGDPDETISSRAAKGQHKWYWRLLGYLLEWLDPGHLQDSVEPDEGDDAVLKQRNKDGN